MCPTSVSNTNLVEIKGFATLCFDELGSWFKGSIESEDQTQYAINGQKSNKITQNDTSTSESSCDCINQVLCTGEDLVSFNVRIYDCDVGEEFTIKRAHGKKGNTWSFSCDCLQFTSEQTFKGQRADMIAKQFFGQTNTGVKTIAFYGPIKLKLTQRVASRHWVL